MHIYLTYLFKKTCFNTFTTHCCLWWNLNLFVVYIVLTISQLQLLSIFSSFPTNTCTNYKYFYTNFILFPFSYLFIYFFLHFIVCFNWSYCISPRLFSFFFFFFLFINFVYLILKKCNWKSLRCSICFFQFYGNYKF